MSVSTYEIVLKNILDKMNEGIVPWRKTWSNSFPHNFVTGKEYHGINYFIMAAKNVEAAATYNQIKSMGGTVSKGCEQIPIVYWNFVEKKDEKTNEIKKIPFAKYYKVIPMEYVKNINENNSKEIVLWSANNVVNDFIRRSGINLVHNAITPAIKQNTIKMVNKERFESEEAYFSELFRLLARIAFMKDHLNNEKDNVLLNELTEELTSAFICAKCGIEGSIESASKLQTWNKEISKNPRILVSAASRAHRAANYILYGKKENESSL